MPVNREGRYRSITPPNPSSRTFIPRGCPVASEASPNDLQQPNARVLLQTRPYRVVRLLVVRRVTTPDYRTAAQPNEIRARHNSLTARKAFDASAQSPCAAVPTPSRDLIEKGLVSTKRAPLMGIPPYFLCRFPFLLESPQTLNPLFLGEFSKPARQIQQTISALSNMRGCTGPRVVPRFPNDTGSDGIQFDIGERV